MKQTEVHAVVAKGRTNVTPDQYELFTILQFRTELEVETGGRATQAETALTKCLALPGHRKFLPVE